MKKSIKSVLAKSLAVVMAFSLAGIAPNTSSDAAAKKPTVTKKVSVKVGKTKTVKVTSKKTVKKTTWSLTKAGKKIVSLSKKKKKSVTVKGKKAGKATLTAKIKVGKKTYKKTCKITVTKAAATTKPTVKPTDAATAKPTATATNNSGGNGGTTTNPTPTPTQGPAVPPASSLTVDGKTLTVDEDSTYRVALTELNETTFTCDAKRPDENGVHSDILYNRDGSVTFASKADYNSGVSYYINPCTSEDQIEDISDTRGDGFLGYKNGTKDMFSYDYVRVVLSSENEMNCRTYNGNDALLSQGFPGSATSETYEGGWIGPAENYMEAGSKSAGNTVKEEYVTRTVFIPIESLMAKGMNPETLTAIAFCPQASGEEVTIYDIAFVKVNYETKVTGIEVTSNKTEVANGRTANLTATVTPDDATRKIVKWTSSNEDLATVNYAGTVVAAAEGTGEVTFTATSTDGSDVSGSITLKIGESAAPAKIVSQNLDLSSADIVAKNNGGSEGETATQSAAGIQFGKGASMLYVDFSAYLAANSLDLADYDSLKVTYQLKNSDGTDADTTVATYGKVALAASSSLNGYDGGVKAGWMSNYIADTKEVTFSDIDASDLATVAGFNFQASATAEDQYYVISDITLYKDNNVYVDLTDSGIVGKTNPGQGESIAATQSAAGIEFMDGKAMAFVNFSEYLTANSLDLAEYKALEVVWEVQDTEGNAVTDYAGAEGAPTYGKIAYAPEANLNGYGDGIDYNWEGEDDTTKNTAWLTSPYTGETCTLTIAKTNPTELATVAGFNLQLQSLPAGMHIVVKSITLVSE